jgi:HAD superfamily hydrolase (TIGR01509 family)
MLEAIIFDLNGVFLESEYLSDRMERDHGVDSKEFIAALKDVMPQVRKPGAKDSFELWRPYFSKWGVELDEKEFFDYWFSGEQLVQELLDYTKELRKQGTKVFILSNNFRERTTYYREHFPEIFDSVDAAYFSWETGFIKPDEQAYRKILEDHNLNPEHCAYFDDSNTNVKVANFIGIKAFNYEGIQKTKQTIQELQE